MALSQSSLSTKIENEIKDLYGDPDDPQRLKDFCDAVAKAVVDEITQNAVVTGNANVSSGSSAGTWPVTGTVT